ncbi:MAG TPA: helix-turn-helix transcriptional regulator [Chloroflexia bacterium]|jgi:transcriptional regulator with XRE-family HTH domain
MVDTESIGQRVRKFRAAKGWSQRMLGARAQTSGSYVSQLESGALGRPGVERLGRIATALGVSLDELINSANDSGRGADADDAGTDSGGEASGERLKVTRVLGAIQRELLAIAALDPEELNIIARVLRLRRAKLERDRQASKS